ncbi:MAG TPA: hypothetical protein DEA65_00850 [Candidatus Marinimicrobia bacterium]|nr:hypothetical protein [Candidatus Neomarinimicrobiota bacterium]HBR86379.1 hypothetical protein [Candidatus Neomarinimicrobiota bacterium]
MEAIIQALKENPVYLAVAVVLAIVILFGVIRKLIKLVLVMAAVLVIYIAYLVWTGEEVDMDRIKEGVQSAGESISEKAGEIGESMKEKVGETVEEKLDEKVEDLISPN